MCNECPNCIPNIQEIEDAHRVLDELYPDNIFPDTISLSERIRMLCQPVKLCGNTTYAIYICQATPMGHPLLTCIRPHNHVGSHRSKDGWIWTN